MFPRKNDSSYSRMQHTKLTTGVLLLNITMIVHNAAIPMIRGIVTNMQNGQQGPATMIGLPSFFSKRTNMFPSRRAQQQQYLWQSSGGLPLSATSRSHLVDTAKLLSKDDK